jgi:hypothetical protein
MKKLSKFKNNLLGRTKKEPTGGLDGKDENSSPGHPPVPAQPAAPNIAVPSSGQDIDPPSQAIDEQPPLPAQPAAPDTAVPSDSSAGQDIDPWSRAFDIVQARERELMTDYKKHLASLQGTASAASGDLSTPRSVESILKQLLKDREEKQWMVSLMGKPVKIREQGEKLVKFLLWTDPIVKNAVSAQPYAALAWTGVSMLLPVGEFPGCRAYAYRGSS